VIAAGFGNVGARKALETLGVRSYVLRGESGMFGREFGIALVRPQRTEAKPSESVESGCLRATLLLLVG
jgi:hypothetical protein